MPEYRNYEQPAQQVPAESSQPQFSPAPAQYEPAPVEYYREPERIQQREQPMQRAPYQEIPPEILAHYIAYLRANQEKVGAAETVRAYWKEAKQCGKLKKKLKKLK